MNDEHLEAPPTKVIPVKLKLTYLGKGGNILQGGEWYVPEPHGIALFCEIAFIALATSLSLTGAAVVIYGIMKLFGL